MRVFYKNPPAIIPDVQNTPANRRLCREFWKYLSNASLDNIETVAQNFIKLHPSKEYDLVSVAQYYAHLCCLNYEIFSEEWEQYTEHFQSKNKDSCILID